MVRPSATGTSETDNSSVVSRVPLAPHLNFRDLGGYPVRGGTVRAGVVYRSAHLHEIEESDRAALQRLEIRTVCDLRNEEEAESRPGPFVGNEHIAIRRLAMMGSRATGDPVQTILEYGITEVRPSDLARIYRLFVDDHARAFGHVVETVADRDRHAVVVHCSAGKDRTGIAAALLLAALGATDDVIVSDYEMTNDLWSPRQIEGARRRLRDAGVDIEPLRTYFLAPGEAMQETLAYVRDTHGSVEAYLTGPAGAAPATLEALRTALVV